MSFHPPFPAFPGVPTRPMDRDALARLAEALTACRRLRSWPGIQAHIQRGYVLLWIHLALERELDPPRVLRREGQARFRFQAAFVEAAAQFGLHDRVYLVLYAQSIATAADELWRQAKTAQATATKQPLLNLF